MEGRIGDFILALPVLVFSLVAHEYAHGAAALRQGDDTAYSLGRLTFNPLPHIDPWMTIILPAILWFGSGGAFTFGGAKPIPVNSRKYRHYKRGDIIVSGAGVVTNLVLAVVFTIFFALSGLAASVAPGLAEGLATAQRMWTWGILLNLNLAVFNMIPVPPLDGSHIFYYLLPPDLGARYRSLQRFGFVPLMVLLLFARPVVSILMTPAWLGLRGLLTLVLPYAIGDTWNIFSS